MTLHLQLCSTMKPTNITILVLAACCALWLGMMVEETSAAPQINWGQVSWTCTVSCTAWNACFVRNGFNKDRCPPYPNNCDCSQFAG
ncbi:hypothetical protein Ocin01_16788 [Orchesella cincta]|uniref:Uncharacterized protein n=1 Tax=Orchesella cincta TaxID=48709 RepID=A0A1D2MAJ2_ORCCI|nr:hypothetical protein Ocin01_16788 [Orchesella cincta]